MNSPCHISFEFFPPKTPEGIKTLEETAIQLDQFSPDFFSVTFGAGGSTREGTLETVKILQKKVRAPIAPHLSCLGSEPEALEEIIKQYQDIHVKRIVALRGDLPSGMVDTGKLKYASDLVSFIREKTHDYFQLEVAAYPECHPQCKTIFDDIIHLKKKIDAGANRAITQYFYNADAYFYFLDQCAKKNISVPIIPGIMPIFNFSKLMRFSDMCGAEMPRWLQKQLSAYGDDAESIKALGLEFVYHLCETLLMGGAPGLHFYTLNQSTLCETIVSALRK